MPHNLFIRALTEGHLGCFQKYFNNCPASDTTESISVVPTTREEI